MSLHVNELRLVLKAALKRLGLLPLARWSRSLIMVLTKQEVRPQEFERWRRERAHQKRFLEFKRQYGDVLRYSLNSAQNEQKKALIIGAGFPIVEIELGLVKGLELAGFVPIELNMYNQKVIPAYYRLAGVKEAYSWGDFCDPPDLEAAEAIVDRCRSLQQLVGLEYEGARIGKFAVTTALRALRLGSLDLQSADMRRVLSKCVASGMTTATAAQRVLREFRPQLVLFQDNAYTPGGELVDCCLASGIDAIRWNFAHKSNSLMLRRYTLQNRDDHPIALSSESWRLVQAMEWTDAHRERLQRELYDNYAIGDWYSEVGTQVDKVLLSADEIRKRLGLDPSKKTAIIFPHIFWDASMRYGEDLYQDFEEWFIEAVRAACANDQLNWIIKIHPAHVVKAAKEGYQGETAEAIVLRKHIGKLPPHLFMIPADSDICTYSLFQLMDYCLTVRGTIGVEAASFGIPVLTAGIGRYERKGFTIDSESREQYLERLNHLQTIPRLSTTQRELAERYAYCLFLLRPLPLETVTYKIYSRLDGLYMTQHFKTQVNIRADEEWYNAADLGAFAQWVTSSRQPDFLMPLSVGQDIRRHESIPLSRQILYNSMETRQE